MNKMFLKLLTISGIMFMTTGCGGNPESKDEPQKQDNDKYDYVLLAQPVATAVLNARDYFSVAHNVQNDYKAKTNNLEITQASIFVKDTEDVNKINKVNAFLAMVKSEIATLMADPQTVLINATSELEEQFVTGKIGGKPALLSNLLKNGNQIGLGFKEAIDNKSSIDAFVSTLGLEAITNENYYQIAEADASTTIDIKVATPSGAPALAFYNHLNETAQLEIAAANTVLSYLSNSSDKDVVIAPTNSGLDAMKNGANFKLAATITFGNFFVVSTGNDNNNVMDKGDKVLAFQQKGVAGKLFNYLYGDKELVVDYLGDVAAVKDKILTDFQ